MQSLSLISRFNSAKLAIAVGVTAAALAGSAKTAHAAIVYSGVLDTTIVASAGAGTSTVATVDAAAPGGYFTLTAANGLGVKISVTPSIDGPYSMLVGTTASNQLIELAAGASIGATLPFGGASGQSVNTATGGLWAGGTDGYFGFCFPPTNTFGGPDDYGWAQLLLSADSKTVTLVDYAYDSTPTEAIAAGAGQAAVPEPTTLAVFGVPAALGLLRRRRKLA